MTHCPKLAAAIPDAGHGLPQFFVRDMQEPTGALVTEVVPSAGRSAAAWRGRRERDGVDIRTIQLMLGHADIKQTQSAYVDWIRRYIVFHCKRPPFEMGAPEITAFLTWLATNRRVSAATQNQALSALLFLYRDVLHIEIGPIEHAGSACPFACPSS